MSRDDTSMAALQEKWDEHKDRIRKGLDFLAPFLKDDKVNITSIREAFESLRSENAQLRAECGELREALTRCVEELEESVELEGRLSSFVAAAKKARAALSRQKAVQSGEQEFFTCPKCGGHFFGTSNLHPDKPLEETGIGHCHDQFGKGCAFTWKRSDDDELEFGPKGE